MTRKDLRTSEQEWHATRNTHSNAPYEATEPASKRLKWLITALIALAVYGLYITSPSHLPECKGESVPKHCVD